MRSVPPHPADEGVPSVTPTLRTTAPTPEASEPPTAVAVPGPTTAEAADGGPYLPYSVDSYFRSTVEGELVDSARTRSFRSFMGSHPDQQGTPYPLIRGVGGNRWGTAYAEGRAGDPVWRLVGRVPAEVAFLSSTGFHAPDSFGSTLTRTSDSPFVVLDRAHGMSVWAAKAQLVGDRVISVGSAGAFMHDSNGLDRRNPLSDSSVNFRSRGAIPDAMVIRPDRMAWAIENGADLGHVLHLFIAESDSSAGHVYPMVGHESGKSGWGAQGQRLAVSADVDLTRRDCSPAALVLARTLQRHGAYVGDNSGSETGLKAAQDTGRAVWGDSLHARELAGCITWDDFVAVRPG
jgi:hypothetical protein